MRPLGTVLTGLFVMALGLTEAEGAHIVSVRHIASRHTVDFTITFVGPCYLGASFKTRHKVFKGAASGLHWYSSNPPTRYPKGTHTVSISVPKRADHELAGYRVALWDGFVLKRNCHADWGGPCAWCRRFGHHFVRQLARRDWGDTWGL